MYITFCKTRKRKGSAVPGPSPNPNPNRNPFPELYFAKKFYQTTTTLYVFTNVVHDEL